MVQFINNINLFKSFFPKLDSIIMEDFHNISALAILIKEYGFKLEYILTSAEVVFNEDTKKITIEELKYTFSFESVFGQITNIGGQVNYILIDIESKIILTTTIFPDLKK